LDHVATTAYFERASSPVSIRQLARRKSALELCLSSSSALVHCAIASDLMRKKCAALQCTAVLQLNSAPAPLLRVACREVVVDCNFVCLNLLHHGTTCVLQRSTTCCISKAPHAYCNAVLIIAGCRARRTGYDMCPPCWWLWLQCDLHCSSAATLHTLRQSLRTFAFSSSLCTSSTLSAREYLERP
jgi:hypothetical protein